MKYKNSEIQFRHLQQQEDEHLSIPQSLDQSFKSKFKFSKARLFLRIVGLLFIILITYYAIKSLWNKRILSNFREKFGSERYLIIEPTYSFANRMSSLAGGVVIAKATNRKLLLKWEYDP